MRVVNRPEWSQYVHNGEAFSFGYAVSGVSGVFNLLQVYNPVGSGVRIVIFQAEIGAGSISQTICALDTAVAVAGQVVQQQNMLAGSTNTSKAVVSTSQPASLPTTAQNIRQSSVAANTKDDVATPGSICELMEGSGFDILTGTTNVTSAAGLWWAEVPTNRYA